MDQSAFDTFMGHVEKASTPAPTPAPEADEQDPAAATASPPAATPAAPAPGPTPGGWGDMSRYDQAGKVGAALVSGAANAFYQTKDFLTGETPEAEKSPIRKGLEEQGKAVAEEGVGYGLVEGVSNFAVGMIGAGKVIGAAKLIPKAAALMGGAAKGIAAGGEALGGSLGSLAGAGEAGGIAGRAIAATAPEAAKAAAVGAVTFDPHAERISNLAEQFPALDNPVSAFLAAKPEDSAAAGRFKNALESLGMDSVVGSLLGGLKVYKAVRTGNKRAIAAATREAEAVTPKGDVDPAGDVTAAAPADAPLAPAAADPGAPTGPAAAPLGEDIRPTPAPPIEGPIARPDRLHDARGGDGVVWLDGDTATRFPALGQSTENVRPSSPYVLQPTHVDSTTGAEILPRVEDPKPLSAFPPEQVQDLQAGLARDGLSIVDPEGNNFALHEGKLVVVDPGAAEKLPSGGGAPGDGGPLQVTTHPSGVEGADPLAEYGPKEMGRPTWDIQSVDVAAGGTEVSVHGTPTGAGAPKRVKLMAPDGIDAEGLVAAMRRDTEEIQTAGGMQGAVENGYRFGDDGGRIPWQKLTINGDPQTVVDALRATVSEGLSAGMDAAKGGAIQSDAAVRRAVSQMATAFGKDPAAVMGSLSQAGAQAKTLARDMETNFLVSQSAFQEAQIVGLKIANGNLADFGGSAAGAKDYLMRLIQVGATAQGSALSIASNAGRALRRMRTEFKMDPGQLAKMGEMTPEQLANLVNQTGGTAKGMQQLTQGKILGNIRDFAQYLYVNNLLWGPRTHFVNLTTNTYMAVARPMERIMGSAFIGGEAGQRVRLQALKQYVYMGNSLFESMKMAAEAFRVGDGIISGHSDFANAGTPSMGTAIAQAEFKPYTSVTNLVSNAGLGTLKLLGVPTRALGSMDELFKQITYRSSVMANAHVEGIQRGLDSKGLTDFVRNRLADAFDEFGHATDATAIQEAREATFQQDLLPGTFGKQVQNMTTALPSLRFILPFVKTPTNVLRTGIKMTPGLNLLQTEFRNSIMGAKGEVAQAQAIGQMTTGVAIMSYAGFLAGTGKITGGGPGDPKLRRALMDTGWQPYSYVSHRDDGTPVYTNFGRYDPVGLVMGLIADVVDISARDYEGTGLYDKGQALATAVFLGMAKNLSQKTYLVGLTKTLEAITSPDEDKVGKWAQGMASSMVPASSMLRFVNQTMVDPTMRDVRDMGDAIRATVPGLSATLPPTRDMWGEPQGAHPGIFVNGKNGIVDAEMRRMADEQGVSPGPPSPTISGVDLRDVTLKDGSNAYDKLQQLAGQPVKRDGSPAGPSLKDTVGRIMQTKGYANAPDGEAGTRGTKLNILAGTLTKYRASALRLIKADPNVQKELGKKDAEVRASYAAQREAAKAPTPQQQAVSAANKIGDAFGAQ